MPLNPGDVFAGYTIVRRLGSGGMGEVYLAQHPRLPRRDALKVLPARLTADEEYRQRFSREADIAAELWHPHIVGIHDRGEFEGQLWLSMDFVEGTDAAELLRDRYPSGMPKAEAFEIVAAVADALDYAHLRGLLHRDVKPANILVTEADSRGRRILLADFGIARQIGDISGLTATNMVVGTTGYSAPEQLMGKDIDGRADQYALGCTAFQLLTGAAPYQNSNAAVVISQHLSAAPPMIGERRPELASIDDAITKVLAKDPGARYSSCTDFAAALTGKPSAAAANTVAAQPATAPTTRITAPKPAPPPKPRRRLRPTPVIAAVATLLLLAVAGVVGADLLSRHEHRAASGTHTGTNEPTDSADPLPSLPTMKPPVASSPITLTGDITDLVGVLTPADRKKVETAISNLATRRKVHLRVAYVDSFSEEKPDDWAAKVMHANKFIDDDGLLAINTTSRRFSFHPPDSMHLSGDMIRDAIRRALRNDQWAAAAERAANDLAVAP
jgi:serine/threonine protein kinase, bacterial